MKQTFVTVLVLASAISSSGAFADAKPDQEIKIGPVGNTMVFDKKTLTVKIGKTIKVTLKNIATADSNMSHNFVLAKPGTETAVANEGMAAGEAAHYVKAGPNVIAHTPLAKPGETVSVTFTAPEKGTYPYLCTFPGHAVLMKGLLKVQ